MMQYLLLDRIEVKGVVERVICNARGFLDAVLVANVLKRKERGTNDVLWPFSLPAAGS